MVQKKLFVAIKRPAGRVRCRHVMILSISMILIFMMMTPGAIARKMHPNAGGESGPFYKPMVTPNKTLRVHRVSNLYFSITNYGKLGSESRDLYDPLTQLPAPSCEFPAESNLEYLFQGAIWIGAVVDDPDEPGVLDTLVSIGDDGWWNPYQELYPEVPPGGEVLMLSIRGENAPPYAPTHGTLSRDLPGREFEAISEQDFICVYTDTVLIGVNPDPNDNRPHIPLHIRIIQKSYSWSYEYAEDFVLIDWEIENIGNTPLRNVWMGLYIDADVWHTSRDGYEEAQDDLCGFLQYYYPDATDSSRRTEIFTAYISDNDGDPVGGAFDYRSPRGLSGCRVVRAPSPDTSGGEIQYGFNWWISNVQSQYDWGPQLQSNYDIWGIFPGGGKGTPGGDRAKYQVMSNDEFDYDQIWCAIDHTADGWIPNTTQSPSDLADGFDTRYLYSFGEFAEIPPDTVLPLTVGYICGEKLHKDPANFDNNLLGGTADSSSILAYYRNLDFRDFATNAQWAEWVYDNPGRDSCFNRDTGLWELDGNRGLADTTWEYVGEDSIPVLFWYKGDGCPDFKGPPPPNSPRLDFEAGKGYVRLSWRGVNPGEPNTGSEDAIDSFNGKMDFEGYGIYQSFDALNWTLLRRFDKVDWLPVAFDSTITPHRWVINKDKQYPITTDSVFYLADNSSLIEDTTWVQEQDRDQTHTYWIAYNYNIGFDDIFDSTVVDDGVDVNYYSFTIDGLSKSRGTYFAVTAFDFGDPLTNLSSLESAKSINSTLIYPIDKTDPIMVYPNPYRIDVDYAAQGYESPGDPAGWAEQDRRIWFSNLPDEQKAIIRIWSLDGDLIQAIMYDPATARGNPLGVVYWDLVSRNGQAVVSGLYLYSIEFISIVDGVPDREPEIGKFAIIK